MSRDRGKPTRIPLQRRQGRAQGDKGLGGVRGGGMALCRCRRPYGPDSPDRPGRSCMAAPSRKSERVRLASKQKSA